MRPDLSGVSSLFSDSGLSRPCYGSSDAVEDVASNGLPRVCARGDIDSAHL
jgi:hypothetical protein